MLAAVPDGRIGLFPDELDLAGVLSRWEHAVAEPDRVHVMVTDPPDTAVAWRALGNLAGFDADPLPLPERSTVGTAAATASLRLIADSSACTSTTTSSSSRRGVGQDRRRPGYDVLGDLPDLVPVRPPRRRIPPGRRTRTGSTSSTPRCPRRWPRWAGSGRSGSVRLPGVLVGGARGDRLGQLAVGELLDGDLLEDVAQRAAGGDPDVLEHLGRTRCR